MILGTKQWLIVGVLLALAMVTAVSWILRPDAGPRLSSEAEIRARDPDASLPMLVLLEPGTIVDELPPAGWSHAVVKSVTYLAGGDIDTLPAFAKVSATKFRTVVVANVRRDPTTGLYGLSRIGAGLGTTHNGRDIVISYKNLSRLGVELSTLDGLVLNRAEKALGRSRLAVRSSDFALYDTFVELADGSGKHGSILLRYAILVEPLTGELRSAVWHVDADPASRVTPKSMSLLPDRFIFKCGIHVAAKRVIGNFATSWGFAMNELPTGESIPMTRSMSEMATLDPAEIDPSLFVVAVRETLGDHRPPPP